MKLIFSKGSSLVARLIVILLFAIVLMVVDRCYQPFSAVRFYLDSLIAPLYKIAHSPQKLQDAMQDMGKSREMLLEENRRLKTELLVKHSDLMLLQHLQHENQRLRQLLDSPLRNDEHKMAAQVLVTDTNPYTYQVVINRGKRDGVYVGQPIIDEKGVIGQIFATANSTSRAILICDYKHALPVQILRNDMSMVAVGNGCDKDLTLDFLPNNVDIQVGDVLVTSGLGGRFPEGYPVAVVTSVKTDPHNANLLVTARPTADMNRLRYLLLLWNEQPKLISDQDEAEPETEAEIGTTVGDDTPTAETAPSGEDYAE